MVCSVCHISEKVIYTYIESGKRFHVCDTCAPAYMKKLEQDTKERAN